MTHTHTRSNARAWSWVGMVGRTLVVLAVLALVWQASDYPPAGVTTSTPAVVGTYEDAADMDGEVWWTTTEGCVGEAPCYDPQAFTDPENLPPVSMWVVQDGEVSDGMFAALVERGFRYPATGPEVLYVPMSVMAQECRTDSDCAAVEQSMREAVRFPFM